MSSSRARMDRVTGTPERTLELLSLLQVPRSWPGDELARRLEVTTRTVRRDIDRLRGMGYRIEADKGPDGGYRMGAGADLPPLRFDDEQAVALAICLRSAPVSGVGIEDAAHRALATVRQVMPSRLRHRIDRIELTGVPRTAAGASRVAPEVLEAVSEAVSAGMTLRFGYPDPDSVSRRVQPHGVVARNGRWYLVAWDLEKDDWRTFRLDRMSPRTPTGPAFTPRPVPTGSPAGFLASRAKGSSGSDEWPCVGRVEIDLPAAQVLTWIPDAEVEVMTPGTARAGIGSWSWAGVLAAVLRLDADFRILGPDALLSAGRDLGDRLHTSLPRREEPHDRTA